ncbi:MAG: FprA family A-type flavoprotein [Thermogladius sp.]|nr:FprA family A-type flavoprotein [Thermogladius sp.]
MSAPIDRSAGGGEGYSIVVEEVKPGVQVYKLVDSKTRFFESLWEIPEGITYNAYVVETNSGFLLVDGWKRGFGGLLVEELGKRGVLSRVTHLIVNHMEPDHSGSIPEILSARPGLKVLGHPLAGRLLRDFYGFAGEFKPVQDGGVLEEGGLRLRFLHAPWLHWPETIVTHVEDLGVVFPCDVLGGYGAYREVFLRQLSGEGRERYIKLAKKYFANVLGHYRDFLLKSLPKLREVVSKSDVVAPGHGLVLDRGDALEILSLYEKWIKRESRKILVLYASMYGFTREAATRLAKAMGEQGFEVVVYGFSDYERPLVSEVVSEAMDARGLLVAAPAYENEIYPTIRYVLDIIAHKTGCPRIFFLHVYGWGSRVVDARSMLGELKCGAIEVVDFKPSAASTIADPQIKRVIDFFKEAA